MRNLSRYLMHSLNPSLWRVAMRRHDPAVPPPRLRTVLLMFVLGLALSGCDPTAAKNLQFVAQQTTNQDFLAAEFITVGNVPVSMIGVDLDNDSDTDVVVVNRLETVGSTSQSANPDAPGTITLLDNVGGTLQVKNEFPVGLLPGRVISGHLNGDLFPDLVLLTDGGQTVWIFLNDGTGDFPLPPPERRISLNPLDPLKPLGSTAAQISLVDLNGDASPADVLISVTDPEGALDPGFMMALVNDGTGNFTTVTSVVDDPSRLPSPTRFVAEDFDGDTLLDVAVIDFSNFTIIILSGDGAGGFTQVAQSAGNFILVGSFPFDIVSADFDGDGNTDLAVSNRGDITMSVLMGGGDATFQQVAGASPIAMVEGSGAAERILLGEFTAPNELDMVLVQRDGAAISFLDGDGAGNFTVTAIAVSADPFAIAAGDFNADCLADFILTESVFRLVSVFAGDGAGLFDRTVVGFDTLVTSPTVLDLNGDNTVDDLLVLHPNFDRLVVLINSHPAPATPCP